MDLKIAKTSNLDISRRQLHTTPPSTCCVVEAVTPREEDLQAHGANFSGSKVFFTMRDSSRRYFHFFAHLDDDLSIAHWQQLFVEIHCTPAAFTVPLCPVATGKSGNAPRKLAIGRQSMRRHKGHETCAHEIRCCVSDGGFSGHGHLKRPRHRRCCCNERRQPPRCSQPRRRRWPRSRICTRGIGRMRGHCTCAQQPQSFRGLRFGAQPWHPTPT